MVPSPNLCVYPKQLVDIGPLCRIKDEDRNPSPVTNYGNGKHSIGDNRDRDRLTIVSEFKRVLPRLHR